MQKYLGRIADILIDYVILLSLKTILHDFRLKKYEIFHQTIDAHVDT